MTISKILPITIVVVIMSIIISYIFDRLVLVTTPSISPKILWRVNEPARKGDYVLFRWIHPPQLNTERC